MFRFPASLVLASIVLVVTGPAEAQCPSGQAFRITITGVGGYPKDQPPSSCASVHAMQDVLLPKQGFGSTQAAAFASVKGAIEAVPPADLDATCHPTLYWKAVCGPTYLNTTESCGVDLFHQPDTPWPDELYASGMNIDLSGPGTCATAYFGKKETDGENLGRCKTCAEGNPINPANGNKFQEESDYRGPGRTPLTFSRFYNSQDRRADDNLGLGWRHTFSRRMRLQLAQPPHVPGTADNTEMKATPAEACAEWANIKAPMVGVAQTTSNYSGGTCNLMDGGVVRSALSIYQPGQGTVTTPSRYVEREDGSSLRFMGWESPYMPPEGVKAKLEQVNGGYRYTDENDVVEEYSSAGVLQSIRYPGGVTQTLGYQNGKLASVTDSFGRSLQFGYHPTSGRLQTLTDPAGQQYVYAYDTVTTHLKSVTFPDGKDREYQYGYGGFPNVLKAIVDENNNEYASWTYDAMGRAVSSQHAGGNEQVMLAFNSDGTTTAQDAKGQTRKHSFQIIGGAYRTGTLTRSCITGCTPATSTTTYTNNVVASRTDFNGNLTTYVRNARGLEESRTEASGTPLARTITTQWHATYRLPTQIDEPGRRTTFTHDASGNVLTRTVTDLASGASRTTTWTYNALGQVLTMDGPRTDMSDVTIFTYKANNDLEKITNALTHETVIEEYDLHGNPTRIQDANGVDTVLTYDLRQRLNTRTIDGKTTSFDYSDAGELTKVTLPGGAFLSYGYDAAHRLTDIQDGAGNKIHYTLDAMGNRTKEEVRDPANALKREQAQVFDMLSRLQQIKDASGNVVSQFGYDAQGNRTSQTDAGQFDTTYVPDELNRIKEVLDAADGTTLYIFNSLDQLTKVTDPEGLETSYTLNAFGDVTKQVSPDTDETNYTVDAAGNRISQTDQRGVTVNYSFDKLNRLTLVDYVGSTTEDVTYSYDSTAGGNYGTGRLTGIQDEGGATSLKYDARGNLIEEARIVGSATYTTGYTFDAADRVATITYPSQRVVSYVRNANGQVTQVTSTVGTVTTDIATDIEFLPFGGIAGYKLGNNVEVARAHDLNYRITGITDQGTATIQQLDLDYDLRSNITARADLVDAVTETLGYDDLSRLASSTGGGYGTQGFTYDGVGNRLTQTGATSASYSYETGTHRLASAGGTSFSHDAAGNITGMGALTLSYNLAHRLASVTGGTAAVTNIYNAAGQRVKKSAGGVETLFFHDRQGHLLAEAFSGDQRVRREYVWLDDLPLALESVRTIPEVIVDNAGSGFSSSGAWATATAADQYGASYLKRGPAIEPGGGAQSIVDDRDSGASYTGTWVPSGSTCGVLCLPPNGFVSSDAAYQDTYYRSGTSGTPVFTWNVALSGAGRYRVYVRWARLNGSGLVTYSIGGSSPAVHAVDQSQPSGEWYALGSYEFGASAQVTLTPEPGIVAVADAVRFVAIEDTDSEFARWAAPVETGAYEAFARWPSDASATAAAPFSIIDATGSIDLSRDQSAAAGTWNSLGEFSFDNPATQGVRLEVVWDETVLADAIRFTPVTSAAERRHLAFFHVDHLNTPQKMTDTSQAVVWDASYEPFGKATITAQPHFDNPLRFPGQFEDEETGIYQNWFRDYCPECGRYLQSDPIGLAGGLSTYGYVGSNPMAFVDPAGLNPAAAALSGSATFPMGGAAAGTPGGPARITDRTPWLYNESAESQPESNSTPITQPQVTPADPNNCPENDSCKKAKADAEAAYNDLAIKRIPHYMQASRHGFADFDHYNTVLQRQSRLRDALRRVKNSCKSAPGDYEKWNRLAEQNFPNRHE